MNTDALKNLGLNDDQIKSVMGEYGQALNPLKEQVNTLTADRDGLKGQLETANKQLSDFQAAHKDDADLQAEITKLQNANKDAETKHQESLNAAKLNYLTDLGLTKAGAKNIKAAKSVMNLDALGLDKQGNLTGFDEQLSALKSGDDTKFLFGVTTQDTPKNPKTPQITVAGSPNPDGNTDKLDYSKASYHDVLEAMSKQSE